MTREWGKRKGKIGERMGRVKKRTKEKIEER